MIRALILLLLIAVVAHGATGDITAKVIHANGRWIDLTIEGFTTGASYNFAYGVRNVPSANTPFLTLTSVGFTDVGTPTTIQRTIYLEKVQRKAYPNDAQNDETVGGGGMTVRVVIDDYIYGSDTAITFTAPAGFITNSFGGGQTSAAQVATVVTSSSTAVHQKSIFNWAWPPYQLMDASSKVRCVAFHRHGQQKRPVRAIKITVSDGTTTNTEWINTMSYDSTWGDTKPVVEHLTSSNLIAGLTHGADLTVNAVVYPWVGDAGSVIDTSTGAAPPSPNWGPQPAVCNQGTYQITMARVASDGNDAGTNTVYPEASFNETTAYKFLTIGKALSAIAAFNNTTYGRNDVSGAVVVCDAGNYSWLGSTNSYGNKAKTWATIRRASAATLASTFVSNMVGNTDAGDRIKIEGMTVVINSASGFNGIDSLWFHRCNLNSGGTSMVRTPTVWYVTQCEVVDFQSRAFGTENAPLALWRGNYVTQFVRTLFVHTMLGNRRFGPVGAAKLVDSQSGSAQVLKPIIAYNEWLGMSNMGSVPLDFGGVAGNTGGTAVVQNVFEACSPGNSTAGILSMGSSEFSNHNYLTWHNTLVGNRCFMGYNDNGTVAYYREYWSEKNNYYDRWANKGDTFVGGFDGNRIGAWGITHRVGGSGNWNSQNMVSVDVSSGNNFFAEFDGLHGYEPVQGGLGQTGQAGFVNRQSATPDGSTSLFAGAGGGDYRITGASMLIGVPRDLLLPYDLDGQPWTPATLACGAYSFPAATVPAGPGTITVRGGKSLSIQGATVTVQ